MQQNNKEQYIAMSKYGKEDYPGQVQINLAKSLEEVAILLLVALQAAAKYPERVSETEVNEQIQELLHKGDYDALAYQGLKWLQKVDSD